MGNGKKKSSAAKIVIIVIVIVVLIGAGGLFLLSKYFQNIAKNMTLPASAVVERGSISRSVDGSGALTVADKVEIKVPSEITVSEKLVSEGDIVHRGDVIATIDKSSVTSNIVSLQSDLDSVKQQLKDAKKNKLTEYQIEELQTKQANIETRLALMMLYYENPVVIATEDGIVYGKSEEQSSSLDESGIDLSGIDVSQYLSADNIEDAVMDAGPVKAEEIPSGEDEIITDLDDFDVEIPVTGENPQATIAETDTYTGEIAWFTGETPVTGPFEGSTAYKALIVLTPKEGYAFSEESTPDIDIEGGTCQAVIDDGKLVIRVEFPETEPEPSDPTDQPADPTDQPADPTEPAEPFDISDLLPEGFDLDSYLAQLMALQSGNAMANALGGMDMSSLYSSIGSGIDYSDALAGYTGGGARSTGFTDNTVYTLAKTQNVKISILVDELDIMSISEGQKATITLDALEGSEFEGVISKVSPFASASSGTAKFTVEITIPMAEEMRIGMSASASIVIYEAEDVLLLPLNAVQQAGDDMFVYRSYDENGNLQDELVVETGISDTDYVEIKSGLQEGDTVYYIDPEANPLMQYMMAAEEVE